MPFQSNTTDVREEAGNILAADFADAEIVKEQTAAYAFIRKAVGDYDATSADIDAIRKLEQILAAYFVLRHFPNRKGEADEKYSVLKSLMEQFGITLGAEPDIEYLHTVTTYGSYVAAHQENPDSEVRYYKSTKTLALESQSRLIEQPSVPAMESNAPDYIITNCRDMF